MERIVTSIGWMSVQPEAFQRAVLSLARPKQFAAGKTVFQISDEPGGIYGVVAGSFLVSVAAPDGSMRLAHIIRSGVWFGHGPALAGGRRTLAFEAAEPSTALHVPLAAIDELRARDPSLLNSIASLAEFNIQIAIRALSDLLVPRSEQRIAAVLLRITDAVNKGRPVDRLGYALTQSQLGQMANSSRHVVNQSLARFAAWGWVSVSYGRIKIVNPSALEQFIASA